MSNPIVKTLAYPFLTPRRFALWFVCVPTLALILWEHIVILASMAAALSVVVYVILALIENRWNPKRWDFDWLEGECY